MTEARISPTLRRRRLSAELRALREQQRMTAIQVDKALDWTPGKLARMERGVWQRPNPRDITDLLNLYKVDDPRRRDYLLTLAKQGRERGWWHPYREMLSESYTTFIGLEAEASTVLTFEPIMVPGLLQTPDYARALMRRGAGELSEAEIDKRVEIRAERQKLITESDLRFWAVLDEAVLHRLIGGHEVWRAQIEHLVTLIDIPKVTVQVVPFALGAHPGVVGPITILEFPEPLDPDAVYAENVAGELLIEEPSDVARFKTAYQRLTSMALSPEDSLTMLSRRIAAST